MKFGRKLRRFFRRTRRIWPSPDRKQAAAEREVIHRGLDYIEYLDRLHLALNPASYVEIGVYVGESLAKARCAAVAIDPDIKLRGETLAARSETHIFQMTSDHFFEGQDLRRIFPAGVDLAFIDGMHLFEYALRDFINLERFARPQGLIAIHDCCPLNAEMALREWNAEARVVREWANWWTGDIWKLLPILRQYRPELEIFVLDTPPSGLVLVNGLDPASTVLSDRYAEIVTAFSMDLDEGRLLRFRQEFPTLDSRGAFSPEALCRRLRAPESPARPPTA